MTLHDTLVVLDTCVLLKPRISDVIMDMRAEKLFSAHWTTEIDHEFMRNMVEQFGVPRKHALNRLNAYKSRCPEWQVLVTNFARRAVPTRVDEKDRHVAAAALTLRIAADKESAGDPDAGPYRVLLVTDNLRDFAVDQMAALGISVMTGGAFLDAVYAENPAAARRAVQQAVSDLRNPPYTVQELLAALAKQGARVLVDGMQQGRVASPARRPRPKSRPRP